MSEVTTIGLDLAKHVFQVHGVDAEGATVLRKQLRRARFLYSEMVRKHIANEHNETMPPSMYEYFHGAV